MQALLASGDGNLTYVEITEGDIQEKAHLKLDSEIACLDLSPLGASDACRLLSHLVFQYTPPRRGRVGHT